MIDVEEIGKRTAGHALVRDVARTPRGHARLETAFLYPDGSSVDIFVVPHDPREPLFRQIKLSDLGQSTTWLLDVQVKPWMSKKRQRFMEDALRIYGVTQVGGALELHLPSMNQLMDGVVKLGQACVRVADLAYTKRSSLQVGITEEIEEFLSDADLEFEPNVELPVPVGPGVRVDFVVRGASHESALLALASGNTSQSHVIANEVFRKWWDLRNAERSEERVTIFDDRVDVYREEDLHRLRQMSSVVALSDRATLQDLLAA